MLLFIHCILILLYSYEDSRLVPSLPSFPPLSNENKMPRAAEYLDIEGDIQLTINAEIAYLRVKNGLSHEDARAQVLDMKKTKKLSYNQMIGGNVKWTSPDARKYWSRVVKSAKTLAAKKAAKTTAGWNSWWQIRITTALPEKTL